ncbi:adenylyl-sulfate kinase [Psychroflexus maritimus]|uniref:Adenylyl-sulfate kinase n=1 Tax=Psychroflexus maritimus TaxID=2714865 RepID=A0A967ABL9_9FLAO|nr:adenylyl-sulfate kinase [Psychroflexus maritimus]NGZ89081.1 adenylyl-sulfate kinase [Psychroflexus maritimus]
MNKNIISQTYDITREQRNKQNAHPSFVLWFTGLSGSGKSTLANAVEKLLFEKGIQTYTLDGDNIRQGVNRGLGFSAEDRKENLRRIAEVAKLFVDAGQICFSAFISPMRKDREMIASIVGEKDFFEVFVDTPLEVCEARDVKGLYKKARAGEITNFTGISAPYEAPENPALHIQTANESIEDSAKKIIAFIEEKINKL